MDPDLVKQQQEEEAESRRLNGKSVLTASGAADIGTAGAREKRGDRPPTAGQFPVSANPSAAPEMRRRGPHSTVLGSSAWAAAHGVIGGLIGQAAGLANGASFGFEDWQTITLAAALAFVTALALTVVPLMRRENLPFRTTLRVLWPGALLYVALLGIALGVAKSGRIGEEFIANPALWAGMSVAAVAGFLATWPIIYFLSLRWLLTRCAMSHD